MANKRSGRLKTRAAPQKKSIQVISRAIKLLHALEGEPDGLSLREIAARIELPLSTVQRIVDALREGQFVISASPSSGVRLGPTLTRLAASASVEFDHITRPIMLSLSKEVGETVDVSVRKGNTVVFTDQIQGRHRLSAISAIGDSFPLHCTANGKALLSVFSPEELQQFLKAPLIPMTENTITKPRELLKEIEIIRRTGLAVDDEEHTEGISAIGTGFRDPLGRAIALSIPVPTTRFRRTRGELGAQLLLARDQIRAALGVPSPSRKQ
jgi:DNA-binding IclR family transcriptional regulator